MKKWKLGFLFLSLVFIGGCWDQTEPERMLYIHAIGVDFKDNKFEIYSQIIDFANAAKSDQPVSQAVQSEVGFAKGDTLEEAFFELYHSTDQRLFWGHLSYLVLSEELLKNGMADPVIDSFIRYRETRYQIWLYCTKDPVQDVLLTTPIINTAITLSNLANPTNTFKQSSFIHPVDIRTFIINVNEPSHEAAIPFVKVTENWETVEGKNTSPSINGVGIVTSEGLKGYLLDEEVKGLQWVQKDTVRGEVSVKKSTDDNDFISFVLDKLKTKITPIIDGDKVKFQIEIHARGELSSIQGKSSYSKIEKIIKEEIEKQVRETYIHALRKDIDIYRFSEQVYRKKNTFWKKHHKDGKIDLDENSIEKITVEFENIKAGRKSGKETIERK